MSNVAIEHPRAFPTTVGFRVQGGFELPVQPPPPSTPAPVVASAISNGSSFLTPSQQLPKLSSVPPPSSERPTGVQSGLLLQRSLGPSHGPRGSGFASSVQAQKPVGASELISAVYSGVPESPAPVGWKGLLEFSETSGCSGVLGQKTTSEDLDSILNRDCKIEICCTAHTSPAVRRLVKSVIRGLRACQEPEKASDGMGGTYFFANDAGKKAAILKPCDEEPLAPNNPKGYVGRQLGDPGWKPTVRVGEAAIREVAAYLLDHDGWARVPTSVLVRARHPVFCYQASQESTLTPTAEASAVGAAPILSRTGSQVCLDGAVTVGAADTTSVCASPATPAQDSPLPMKLGSLQEFVTHECDTSEMGPSRFSVRDVHRIGILDLRLFNTDRHAGNMLVRTPRTASMSTADLRRSMVASDAPYELIPIDHGFCLPETLEAPYFEWLHWPQTMLPFSEEELQYIKDLDVERDKTILRTELPMLRPECLRVLEVCTTLLKTCAADGLTLFDIASVMTRPFVDSDEEPSELERMCAFARQCVEYTQELNQCDEDEIEDAEGVSEVAADEQLEDEVATEVLEALSTLPKRGSTITSIKEEGEDMLFELDVDSTTGVSYMVKRRAGVAGAGVTAGRLVAAESSPDLSPCSSLSTMDERMSIQPAGSIGSSGMLNGFSMVDEAIAAGSRGAPDAPPSRAAGAERAVPMASSVHVTDGFLWRKLKSQQAVKRATNGKVGALSCTKRGRMAPQVYPPPVAAFSPERMSACFSGMTEEHWGQFMEVVQDQIRAALQSGRWRQSAADMSSMALSCPRF
ncbi:hypothetical protein PLESTB_000780500 [Pleodorina starrii]|uniref:1-phosphatidylinositol 4-kinase n=1 Tax=Pleodorina starrii TaxID=330485 RepID=A0A9W6BKD5_9CHLO|nr:hypothetical protein PLESTM_000504400 [Pleodorina starrii]GLC53724.1 hypothetical protein PLESTB_000780500 [Pleodorina starrii]GLC72906.1 hypothetical protein PLESTF_001308300 [Pleodorina starrii]